jgi:hypothetical protein
MRSTNNRRGVAVGGAPPWCQDPERCDLFRARAKRCRKCRNVPHLPATLSNLAEGSRSVGVYYPQGMLRRPLAESDLHSVSPFLSRTFLPHQCGGIKSVPEAVETAPYPGHTLFQDSFFFCKFKKIGDAPGLENVYVEIGVDGSSGLAFAKIYPTQSPWNAADIFSTRVAPFFERHGVPIEQVITPNSREYSVISTLQPFEISLAASGIRHTQTDRSLRPHLPRCSQFFGVLQHEFFAPVLRGRFQHTLESLQQELDHFMAVYNSDRPSPAPGMHGRPPLRAFLDTARA